MPINSFTPVVPSSSVSGQLKEKAFELTKKASGLTPHAPLLQPLSQLVRVMNCYYSNLIEGHHTLPYAVEHALNNDLSSDSATRDLQQEALAHIQVQSMIDHQQYPQPALSLKFLLWCHAEFYQLLPTSMAMMKHPQTDENIRMKAGEIRQGGVQVGHHIAPDAEQVTPMLEGLFKVCHQYHGSDMLIAIAAANHRVAWIHPFMDGNGRTIRLMAHAALQNLGLNIGLWSPSRGLARSVQQYKYHLAQADQTRQGSFTDGRGALSEKGLVNFCDYYLSTCIDQVDFMSQLFDMKNISKRIEKYCMDEHHRSKLSLDSFILLREALYRGEFERGEVKNMISGKSDVTARRVLKGLLDRELLVSDSPRGRVRLHIPSHVLGAWFPNLYPEHALLSPS